MTDLEETPAKRQKVKLTSRPAAEEDFIAEMTRKLLVDWCRYAVVHGALSTGTPDPEPFMDFAIAKGWVSKDGTKILAPGWKTAAAFLRR